VESAEVRRLLEETHALLNGHFLLASGKHSDKYFQCARVLASPARASLLGAGIGGKWADESIDAVFGPAIGGIVIAHEVARYLGSPAYYTEREEGKMRLRRGFTVDAGARARGRGRGDHRRLRAGGGRPPEGARRRGGRRLLHRLALARESAREPFGELKFGRCSRSPPRRGRSPPARSAMRASRSRSRQPRPARFGRAGRQVTTRARRATGRRCRRA
jgi:hypothetical protein